MLNEYSQGIGADDLPSFKGMTIARISVVHGTMIFRFEDGSKLKFYHEQVCCVSVDIEDVIGDLSDLLESPLTMAEVTSKQNDKNGGSETWTFYKFATIKGSVTVRWHGISNGYYSERVSMAFTPAPQSRLQ